MTVVVETGPTLTLDGPACAALRPLLDALAADVLTSMPGRLEALAPVIAGVRRVADAHVAAVRVARLERAAIAEWVPVAEAARAAGVSERAIRAQCQRGTRAGEKRAGRWFVDPVGP